MPPLTRRPPSLACLALTLLALAATGCGRGPGASDAIAIDASLEPEQTAVEAPDPIRTEAGGFDVVITPVAHYVLRGIVVSRESYRFGWNAELSPCDVAMVWGPLAADGGWRRLSWSQSGRWYYWRWSGERPFSDDLVVRSSSNTHVIPASSGLRRVARSLTPGDLVELTGDLVAVEGRKGAEQVWWRSSLSRSDSGDGSCELMYVRKIRVGGKSYE